VFGRLPVAWGLALGGAAAVPDADAPALPDPDDDPLELEPELCGLGDSGWMLPLGVVWVLEPPDPEEPDPPVPPNGSWYC
jgi:hypothetical protein